MAARLAGWAAMIGFVVLAVRTRLWLVLAVVLTFAIAVAVLEERDRRVARRLARDEADDDARPLR